MMMPSIFREDLFDDLMSGFAFPSFTDTDRKVYGKRGWDVMKTDVRETDSEYEVEIDLPGFSKEDIKMQLDRGCLTVSAAKTMSQDEKDENGKYVRRERYAGNMSRSFYVGEHITEEDIHPKYENGILSFRLPKEEKKAIEAKERYISIE